MKDILIRYVQDELLSGRVDQPVAGSDDLLGSGLVDSIAMMRLISFIEKRCGLKIPVAEITLENFMTIDAIVSYLTNRE